jgi:hypothetical protein
MAGRNRLVFLAIYSISLLVATSGPVAFANEDTDSARALFTEARRLASDGQYERACPLFERSLKLESGIGTQFNLADCWEHVGRNASAYYTFLAVAAASKDKGQTDREHVASQRAEALLPKLSRLQVKSDSTVKAIRVSHDGVPLADRPWSEPTAVDPGSYTVASVSGNDELWKTQVTVPPHALTVIVAVPPSTNSSAVGKHSSDELATISKSSSSPDRQLTESVPPPASPNKSGHQSSGVWPAAGLLVGGAGLAVGTIFALLFESKNGQARDICPTNFNCSESDIRTHDSLVSDAKTARTGAYIAFGLGAASITAATVYYVSKPANHEKPPASALKFGPAFGSGNGSYWGAAAQGSW